MPSRSECPALSVSAPARAGGAQPEQQSRHCDEARSAPVLARFRCFEAPDDGRESIQKPHSGRLTMTRQVFTRDLKLDPIKAAITFAATGAKDAEARAWAVN